MALLTAPAGAGKTRTIAAAATVWHALTGGRLIGLTLSENAARVMMTEGLPEAYNIAQLPRQVPPTPTGSVIPSRSARPTSSSSTRPARSAPPTSP